MSDFSGGPPRVGFTKAKDGSLATELADFIYPAESLIALFSDHLAQGGDAWGFILSFFDAEIRQHDCELIRALLSVFGSSDPREIRLTRDCLHWISGGALAYDNEALGQLAKRNGLSKQAFAQRARKIERGLGCEIRSQTHRTEEAREKMSRRTTRRMKV